MKQNREPNALIHEQSPYLLQHAYNPVQWRAWNDETFRLAAKSDKPVFVSIGYSTCHWCHVMERESFEDDEVAHILNTHFIPVKVDREERPDVDAVYMAVCQAMTGHGGWPLSAFLTPEKEPFFAGTYYPKRSRGNRVGFVELTSRIAELWQHDRGRMMESAHEVMQELRQRAEADFSAELHEDSLHAAYLHFTRTFDDQFGGFGAQPKFPSPHNLLFLLRYYRHYHQPEALVMVQKTLKAMRLGGIFDHVGLGFHRYSTDRFWLLPHFEKMLYDNAMLMMAYAETYALTQNPFYKTVVDEIAAYIDYRMTSPDGAFYSAEDADSEGEEGKFYVWSAQELQEILGSEDASLMMQVFHCREEGNFFEEASGHQTGTNIPYLREWHDTIAAQVGLDYQEWIQRWEHIRQQLFRHREQRIHPLLDDKVLADWNGLMIAAFALAGRYTKSDALIGKAEKAWTFIHRNMMQADGKLSHRYRQGHVSTTAFADDYVFCAWAAYELYQATGNSHYIVEAKRLIDIAFHDFLSVRGALGVASTQKGEGNALPAHVDAYDGAIPSANSVAVYVAQRIGLIVDDTDYQAKAESIIKAFGKQLASYPAGFCMMNMAYLDLLHGLEEVVILPGENAAEYDATTRYIQAQYSANRIILRADSGQQGVLQRLQLYPQTQNVVVYICSSGACHTTLATRTETEEYFRP